MIKRSPASAARDVTLATTAVVLAALFVLFGVVALLALILRITPSGIAQALRDPVVAQALWLSLRTSLLSSLIIVALGTPVAAVLSTPFRGRAALETLVMLPVVLPPGKSQHKKPPPETETVAMNPDQKRSVFSKIGAFFASMFH